MTDDDLRAAREHEPRRQLLDDDPPPIRTGKRKPILLMAAGAILFVLILIVLLNIDAGIDERSADEDEITELISPRAMRQGDQAAEALDLRRGLQPQLARGGWIQIAGEDGRLAQQYRCERLDPRPDGWLEMQQPEMEIYLERDRVVTLRGDSALAHAPNNAIESGTITGNVVVKLFDAPEGGLIDVENDEPAMVVNTDEASFDNFLGEIRCDDWVRITSPQLELPGRELSLLHDDQNNRFQLRIQQFDFIRIFDEPRVASGRAGGGRSAIPAAMAQPETSIVEAAQSLDPLAAHTASADAQFYVLTLRDQVRIDHGPPAERRMATGDQLELIFSTKTKGLNQFGSHDTRRAQIVSHEVARPASLRSRLVVAAIGMVSAGQPAQPSTSMEHLMGPGITLVRSDGPLMIAPVEPDDARIPHRADDAYLEMHGSPVMLCDLTDASEAVGRTLTYATAMKEVQLIGSPDHPLLLSSPELAAGGERFRFSDLDRTGGFIGGGWLTSRERTTNGTSRLGCASLADSALLAAARPPAPPRASGPPPAPEQQPELHITWDEGMDLRFDEGRGDSRGSIREAVFRGNVRVSNEEFTMNAGEMTAGFPDGGAESRAIESIHARRDVRVIGAGTTSTSGEIQCQDLLLTLEQNAGGETIPKRMIATGSVQAMEDDHIIWSDSLRVTFFERTEAPVDEPPADRRRRNVDVEELIAETDVQVLLADGTRAYADRLTGDGIREVLELSGDNVVIVSDTMLMDEGRRLILDRPSGTATSPGPGQLRLYEQPILPDRRERIERPDVDDSRNRQEIRVRWEESFSYDSTFNDGAGAADFRGNVDAVAEPSQLERSTMTGQALTLEFINVTRPDSSPEESRSSSDSSAPQHELSLDQRGRRDLSLLLARRDAKLESHTWDNPDKQGEPNVFFVAGQHVEYHPLRNEAIVVGDGELLIHDIRKDADEAPQSAPFGAKGSTMMTWSRRLHMTNPIEEIFQLAVDGEITMRHRDLEGAMSWMSCEQLEATIVRDLDDEQLQQRRGGLDFGGSSRMERVKASGGVNVRTDQRDIACEAFDYDVPHGIARATATPPHVVAIQTTGVPGVTSAQEILWNMAQDTIRILRAAGTGPN